MKHFKRIIFYGLFIFSPGFLFCQTPIDDLSWEQTPFFIDDFTIPDVEDTHDNNCQSEPSAKWMLGYPWGNNMGHCQFNCNIMDNLDFSDGHLSIQSTHLSGLYREFCYVAHLSDWQECATLYNLTNWQCDLGVLADTYFEYTSGDISSKTKILYGFIEVKCKMPTSRGFHTTFWTYGDNRAEIDIVERPGSCDNRTFTVGYHWAGSNGQDLSDGRRFTLEEFGANLPSLSESFYTYAVEWSPKTLIYYFNGIPIFITLNNNNIDWGSQFLNIGIGPDDEDLPLAIFPNVITVAYIKVFKLRMGDVNTVINSSYVNFSTFNYSVKKSITLSNSTVPNNFEKTLRATDFIQLNGDFTVPYGSELTLLPTGSY